jgi:hypothetical protein
MIRLCADLRPVTLLAALPLAACATAPPPYATNALAWPRAGESVNQFQGDDLACRNYMQTHTPPPGAPQAVVNRSAVGRGASNAGAIAEGTQSPSDVTYAQCMTSKGYSVEYVNLFAPQPPGYGDGNAYWGDDPNDADVRRGGYSYYVAYPYAVGTLPFFFFVTHHHDDVHHEGFGHGGARFRH